MFKKTKKGVVRDFIKVNLPDENENIFIIEENGLSIFDVVQNIRNNEVIKDLHIISFRISKKDLSTLEDFDFDFKTKLLLSDSIPSMVVGTYNYLLDNKKFDVEYKNIHEKSTFVKTENNYYFITSSGNFNPDGKIEFISIFNSKEVYNLLMPEIWKKEKEEVMEA